MHSGKKLTVFPKLDYHIAIHQPSASSKFEQNKTEWIAIYIENQRIMVSQEHYLAGLRLEVALITSFSYGIDQSDSQAYFDIVCMWSLSWLMLLCLPFLCLISVKKSPASTFPKLVTSNKWGALLPTPPSSLCGYLTDPGSTRDQGFSVLKWKMHQLLNFWNKNWLFLHLYMAIKFGSNWCERIRQINTNDIIDCRLLFFLPCLEFDGFIIQYPAVYVNNHTGVHNGC